MPLLQAVEHQFHTGRDSKLIEDAKKIIPHDLLLGISWSPRKVALTIYALTAAMCMIAWLVLKCDFTHALLLCAASIGTLTITAVRLGVLRSNDERRPQFSAAQYRRL